MTKREAAIVTAYTGTLIGEIKDFHEYAEEKLSRPVMTHEFGFPETWDELKEESRDEFMNIELK